jgi:hypothetical protein
VHWGGVYGTINAAAGHHLSEGRWLRDRSYMDGLSRFWIGSQAPNPQASSPGAFEPGIGHFANGSRGQTGSCPYSSWILTGAVKSAVVKGDLGLGLDLRGSVVSLQDMLPQMVDWWEALANPNPRPHPHPHPRLVGGPFAAAPSGLHRRQQCPATRRRPAVPRYGPGPLCASLLPHGRWVGRDGGFSEREWLPAHHRGYDVQRGVGDRHRRQHESGEETGRNVHGEGEDDSGLVSEQPLERGESMASAPRTLTRTLMGGESVAYCLQARLRVYRHGRVYRKHQEKHE